MKVRTPWYNEPGPNSRLDFCDGSRSRCDGCLCRYPEYAPYRCVCLKCNKYFYELLDAFWKIRQDVYKQYAFKEKSYEELFCMEFEIEEKMADRCHAVCSSTGMGRSAIITKYTDIARKITDDVIQREMNKICPDDTDTDTDSGFSE